MVNRTHNKNRLRKRYAVFTYRDRRWAMLRDEVVRVLNEHEAVCRLRVFAHSSGPIVWIRSLDFFCLGGGANSIARDRGFTGLDEPFDIVNGGGRFSWAHWMLHICTIVF